MYYCYFVITDIFSYHKLIRMSKAKPIKQKTSALKEKILPESSPVKSASAYIWSGIIMILVLGGMIYSNTYDCSFQFDDKHNIIDNEAIRSLSNLKAMWDLNQSRFLAFYSFALNYHFGQLNVQGYHAVNVLIHLTNSILIFFLTQLLFTTPVLKNNSLAGHAKSVSLITALMFVAHPLATGSVTYIVQRMASMVALFYFLALILYIKGRLSESKSKYGYFAGSLLAAVMAIHVKENAYTLPLVIVLIEFYFIQQKMISIKFKNYKLLGAILGLAIIMIFAGIKYFSASIFQPIPPSIFNSVTITSSNYFYTQLSVIVKYIQLLIFPMNQNIDYDFPIAYNLLGISTILNGLILTGLLILAVYLYKRNRLISFGILWFFLSLSIESSIIPISDVIFEHRTYIPSFGFFIILSSVIYGLFWNNYKNRVLLFFVLLIGTYSSLAFQRNKVWKDELSLWSDAVEKSPKKARPYVNRGYAYGNLRQWSKSINDFEKVNELFPNQHTMAYYNLGIAYWNTGNKEKSILNYSKAVELDSTFSDAYYGLAVGYHNLNEPDKGIANYSKVITLNPKNDKAYYGRGMLMAFKNQWQVAIADYSKAIAINPNDFNFYYNRGMVYGKTNQFEKASEDFTRVLQLNPQNKSAYSLREMANAELTAKMGQ